MDFVATNLSSRAAPMRASGPFLAKRFAR
jgi:hypothetical protein